MKNMFKIFKKSANKPLTPRQKEARSFEKKAKEQFLKLKEKGLMIPILTF